jgi:hypothetical protein
MAVFQRAGRKVWWFEFEYRGRRYRESAGTRSKTLAIDIERKRRRDVEESANGIRRNRDAAILFPVAAKEWLAVKKAGWAPKSHVIASTDIDHLKTYSAEWRRPPTRPSTTRWGPCEPFSGGTGSGRRWRQTSGC